MKPVGIKLETFHPATVNHSWLPSFRTQSWNNVQLGDELKPSNKRPTDTRELNTSKCPDAYETFYTRSPRRLYLLGANYIWREERGNRLLGTFTFLTRTVGKAHRQVNSSCSCTSRVVLAFEVVFLAIHKF